LVFVPRLRCKAAMLPMGTLAAQSSCVCLVVSQMLRPAGGSKVVASCTDGPHVARAMHRDCLLASFQKHARTPALEQPLHRLDSASFSRVLPGQHREEAPRCAMPPESCARLVCSISRAWSCNTATLVDFRCRSACGSQSAHCERHRRLKHGRKNAHAP
jgi:hypothetical protein